MTSSLLLVGLGNPGKEYEGTRHNYGFMAIDALLEASSGYGPVTSLSGQKDAYKLWRTTLGKRQCFLLTPMTFMNRSGDAVQRVSAYYRINPEDILVYHDELDLPLGRMKLKKGGGNAGHNGLKSIQQMLGTPDFYRMRLGIGRPIGGNGASYVLSRFTKDEGQRLESSLKAAVEGTLLFTNQGPQAAQQFCNAFSAVDTTSMD